MACLVGLAFAGASPCAADPALSPSQVQALEQRDYHADKQAVFGSVVDVLQDLGFTVDSADIQSGFVKAESATVNKTGFLDALGDRESSGNTRATAFIEALSPTKTRVRLTFLSIKTTSGIYGQGARGDHELLDPQLFQRAFNRIDAAVLERTGPGDAGGALAGAIVPIGALGQPQSASVAKPKGELLAMAKQELEAEGFQLMKDDEAAGSIVTAPMGVPLTMDQADCGKMFGISYLRDKRASTDVQYFVDVTDGVVNVRVAIDGLYRTGYGNPDKPLTCASRGVIEAAFLAKIAPGPRTP